MATSDEGRKGTSERGRGTSGGIEPDAGVPGRRPAGTATDQPGAPANLPAGAPDVLGGTEPPRQGADEVRGGTVGMPDREEVPELLGERSDYPIPIANPEDER